MIRMQQNALVQHFKIEDPFITAVPVQIVFLYAEFKRGGGDTFYEKIYQKYVEKSEKNTFKNSGIHNSFPS